MDGITEPLPAATVIPVRDGGIGLELLLLRRDSELRNFGGMWVFPGGRVDAADAGDADPHHEPAARRAAVREAQEEADLRLSVDHLVPFSHWTPPLIPGRRFATWFFVARASEGDIVTDGGEVHEHRWVTPVEMLELRDDGVVELAPPTVVTLHQLSAFGDVTAVLNHDRPFERFVTMIARGARPRTLLWHGDAGYSDGTVDRDGSRHRLVMGERWKYERSTEAMSGGGDPTDRR